MTSPARLKLQDIFHAPSFYWSLILFLAAAAPRILWALEIHPQPFSDMEDYYLCAINFIRGDGLIMSPDRMAYRAPGYPLFLAACIKMFPGSMLQGIRIAQAFLGAFSVVVIYHLALLIFKPVYENKEKHLYTWCHWLSFAAAMTFSWMETQIFFTSILMTETLFVFLLLVWVYLLIEVRLSHHYLRLVGCSLLLGVLALVRPIALIFLPLLVFQVLCAVPQHKKRIHVWLPLFGWILPILPWTIRNIVVLNAFVILSTNSGVNFYIGHNPEYGYYNTGQKEQIRQQLESKFGKIDEVEEDRYFFRIGMDYVLNKPFSLIPHSVQKLLYLYAVDVKPWPWEEYGHRKGPTFHGIPWPLLRWNPLFLFLALAGLTYAFIKRLNHSVLLSIIGLYTMACLIYFARSRFRIPLEPFLILYGWIGVLSLVETVQTVYLTYFKSKPTDTEISTSAFKKVSVRRSN